MPYADYTNPQALNLYDYIRNNPLGGVDADGHWPMTDPIQMVQRLEDIASNPYVQGGTKIAVGGGLVVTAGFGDVPGSVAGGS